MVAGIEMEVIDLCAVDNGGCDHECRHVDTGNDVICSCHAGYRLQANMASCAGHCPYRFFTQSLSFIIIVVIIIIIVASASHNSEQVTHR